MFTIALHNTAPLASLTSTASDSSGHLPALIVIIVLVVSVVLLIGSTANTVVVVERSGAGGWLVFIAISAALLYLLGSNSGFA